MLALDQGGGRTGMLTPSWWEGSGEVRHHRRWSGWIGVCGDMLLSGWSSVVQVSGGCAEMESTDPGGGPGGPCRDSPFDVGGRPRGGPGRMAGDLAAGGADWADPLAPVDEAILLLVFSTLAEMGSR